MPLSIAIVGAGPRGLWAVEELSRVAYLHRLQFEITVFDARKPGFGAAYDTGQSQDIVLNLFSSAIHTRMGSFDDFRREVLGEAEPLDVFPPRATAGKFLAASWEHVAAHLPAGCALKFEARTVTDPAELTGFDHVLLVTGHEPPTHPEGMIDAYGDLAGIAAGSTVGIRGAALTAIDVILTLTAGRGGRFTENGYVASGDEPAKIFPTSRSGRFIQLKPDPVTEDEARLFRRFHRAVRAVGTVAELKDVLLQAASALVGREVNWEALQVTDDPTAELRDAIADPRRDPQAIGLAWRELYPQIVERVSFSDLARDPEFLELTRTLESFAFGSPAQQLGKVLALIDAGIVDFSRLGAGAAHSEASDAAAEIDTWVDAVLASPGVHPGTLAAQVLAEIAPEQAPTDRPKTLETEPNGMIAGQTRFAFAGRMTEPFVLGNDSLSRKLHPVIPLWTQTLARLHAGEAAQHADRTEEQLRDGAYGTPPLTGRLEPWMTDLTRAESQIDAAFTEYGSPLNVVNADPMERNCAELTAVGQRAGVDVRVFFARKANKALTFVERALRGGHGVDVASYRELSQVLEAGVPGERVILSAAIKTDQLLRLAIENGVTVSVDTTAEYDRLLALAAEQNTTVRVAPRLAPDPARFMPTRFGELTEVWAEHLAVAHPQVAVAGVHLHLHGYSADDRIDALLEATGLVGELREAGHRIEFIDIGGGVPMSYLDDAEQWANFKAALAAQNSGAIAPFTWKADPLKNFYPFHQSPVRGKWLEQILASAAGDAVRELGLRLHLEPGRTVLDGCGMILARVAFVKKRSDGVPLVGLEMNRTQLRTTSDDYLVDPLHLSLGEPAGEPYEGFLVGAYCIEDEVIMRRPIVFPRGVAVGGVLAFPNTAGYFMHILESASHQIPLAKNLVWGGGELALDRIDR